MVRYLLTEVVERVFLFSADFSWAIILGSGPTAVGVFCLADMALEGTSGSCVLCRSV